MKCNIYLDDCRQPVDKDWVIVRDYHEFVNKVTEVGLENIDIISLDHDLADDSVVELTGYDCAKWLVEEWIGGQPVVEVVVHSANVVGAENIVGYINNYRRVIGLPENCVRVKIEHLT